MFLCTIVFSTAEPWVFTWWAVLKIRVRASSLRFFFLPPQTYNFIDQSSRQQPGERVVADSNNNNKKKKTTRTGQDRHHRLSAAIPEKFSTAMPAPCHSSLHLPLILIVVVVLLPTSAYGQLSVQANVSPQEFFEGIFGLVSGIEITSTQVS